MRRPSAAPKLGRPAAATPSKGGASPKATPMKKKNGAAAAASTPSKASPSGKGKSKQCKGKGKQCKGKGKGKGNAGKTTPKKQKGALKLGCSKCRFAAVGCSKCRDPTFSGKRGRA